MVHSISYGDNRNNYNNDTVQRLDFELMKMAARGITVLVASGNRGVNCPNPNVNNKGVNLRQQQPLFPTSPYMTLGNHI